MNPFVDCHCVTGVPKQLCPVPSSNGKQTQPSAEEDQLTPLGGVSLMTGDTSRLINRNRKHLLLLLLLIQLLITTDMRRSSYYFCWSAVSRIFESLSNKSGDYNYIQTSHTPPAISINKEGDIDWK